MDLQVARLHRFLYSHYFFTGIRQGIGMLLPILVLGGLCGDYAMGLTATFGALAVAIIDQAGGPQRYRPYEMLTAAILGTVATVVTGVASLYPAVLWAAVIAQCFFYSLFSVFGKSGGAIGYSVLLLMVLVMSAHLPLNQLPAYAMATLGGALCYLTFSLIFRHLFRLREGRQALSVALFATADYIAARASFYDESTDLDEAYRALIERQSSMTEQHQTARDMVLNALPRGQGAADRRRVMMWNIFVDMQQLTDTLVAMHTDYAALRRTLARNDCLIFMRDALVKLSLGLNQIGLCLARGRTVQYRSSAKAELRAIEYEIEHLKRSGLDQRDPAMLANILQVLRRLRHSARIINRLVEHSAGSVDAVAIGAPHLDKSLTRFLSRQEFRLGLLISNLRLDSPHFRYAVRVTVATAVATTLASHWLSPALVSHSYWILVTILVIMKPGFALTRQRNRRRLIGTLMGCLVALLIVHLTNHHSILFPILLLACILGLSLMQINYMISVLFITLFVVLSLHIASPDGVSAELIGERALDTVIGSTLAFLCSYIMPWWEAGYLNTLARAAIAANRDYLQAGWRYVQAIQAQAAHTLESEKTAPNVDEARVAWRLARDKVHIVFSNFAESFSRMMSEPKSHQAHVPEFNNLLNQNHLLASQVTGAISLLTDLPETPPAMQRALTGMVELLDNKSPSPSIPLQFDTKGDLAMLAYSFKQMIQACSMIRQELRSLNDAPAPRLPRTSQAA